MGLVTNALKSVGKEFLANKAADILDVGKAKDTPTKETAQEDIPVDVSDLISMEDVYEPTVSDADENDPGIVELENYELEPIEDLEDKRNNLEDFYNTWGDWDMFKQNLKSQQDYEQPLDDSATPITVDSNDSSVIPNTDSEPETVSQESTQDSTLPQESTQDSTLPQESASISGNTTAPESIAPLSVPENDIDKQVEEAIESNPTTAEQVTEDVSGEDSPIETEAEQLNDSNPNNDEVADEAVEQTPVKEKQEILDKLDNEQASDDKDLQPITIPDKSKYGWDGYGTTENKYDSENGLYTGVTHKVPNPDYNPRARKNKQPEFLNEDLVFDSHPIKVGDDGSISFNQQQTEPTIPRDDETSGIRAMVTKFGEPYMGYKGARAIIRDREDYYNETMEWVRNGLKEAVDEGDTEKVENIIEEHPEESQEVLPEDTPIQEEAEQITEDDKPQNDEVNNEVVEDFVKDEHFKDIENKPYYDDWVNSEPGSEQFINAYNSAVNDYGKEEVDKQLEAWGIELEPPKDEETTETGTDLPKDEDDEFEAYAKQAGDEAGDRKQLEEEHAKAFEEKLRHNNQQAWKDYALEKSKLNTRGSIRKGFENEVGKSILAEIMTPEEWMNDSLRENVLRHTNYTSNPVEVRNRLRESIAKEKKALGIDEETLKAKEEEEKRRKEEERKRREEAWAKFDKANGINQDKKKAAGSSFINVPKDTEPLPLVSGYKREGDKLLDEYGNEIPDYEPIDTDDGVLAERDEDFLGPDEWTDEEGNIHDYSELANGNTGALDKKWYEGDEGGEGEYSESGNVNLDYEAAELQDQIKEAEALPVTNAEEAKEKQNKLRALRLKLKEVQTATGHGSNVPSAGPTTDNGTQTTGGRASPRAGIGNIGGGAAGHGSMASTRPTRMSGDSHNSIASKAPLPHALEDNQGRVVSVNGKATTAPSSNNNGAFRSGSFGLMSKAKSNLKSIPSKAPVSGGAEHTGTPMTAGAGKGMPNDVNIEDGKQILIERLKQLLTQLTDEEKRKLGFSPALNQWNGKALIRLDGYTLQDLINQVEEFLEENK